jgi:hypothetical protein
MRVASITWDWNKDITKIVFADEFINSDRVVHADVLQDISRIVQEAYEESVKNLLKKGAPQMEKVVKL